MTQDQKQNDSQGFAAAVQGKRVNSYEYFAVAIVSLIPWVGPALFVWTVLDGLIRHRRGFGYLIFISTVFVLGGLYLLGTLPKISLTPRTKDAETKSNVHLIQIALERYWMDHCVYPEEVRTLITERYISEFPINPYTRKPMKDISAGTTPYEGEFTYVRSTVDDDVRAFYVIGYGRNGPAINYSGIEEIPDHAIIVVESGCDCECQGPLKLGEVIPPPLEFLLSAHDSRAHSTFDPEPLK